MDILLSYNVLICLLTIYHVNIFKKKMAETLKPTKKKNNFLAA